MKELHEAILGREAERIESLVRHECETAGAHAVVDDLLRFSVIAFAPSLHSRAAMFTTLELTLHDDDVDHIVPMIVSCAQYLGESHVPWGDAPVMSPPDADEPVAATTEVIDAAVETGDQRRAELWVASVFDRPEADQARLLFDTAARHPGEEGYGFVTAVMAWRMTKCFPPLAWFGIMRMAVLEWMQRRPAPPAGGERSFREAASTSVHAYVASGGRPDLFQPLQLADAILTAEAVAGPGRYSKLLDRFAPVADDAAAGIPHSARNDREGSSSLLHLPEWSEADLAYRYAVDFGAFVQSVPLAGRLEVAEVSDACEKIPAAARHFLMHPEDFEKWSFA